jgi:hypothetical protein
VLYPIPSRPPVLSFDGRAMFSCDSRPVGEASVVLNCDASGRVLCWCCAPPTILKFAMLAETGISCEGVLADGRPFVCPRLDPVSWPSEGMSADDSPLRAARLVIGQEQPAQEWTFALTNLLLPNFSTDTGAANLMLGDCNVAVTLSPLPDYAIRMSYLRAYKAIDLTAMLRLNTSLPGVDFAIAEDFCLIFSVLTGHRVTWITRQSETAIVFEDRVTKPCSGWPVLGRFEEALGRNWDWQTLLTSAGKALPLFQEHAVPFRLRAGLINSWIDARIETDFLETRGLKTVAVLEVIRSAYRDHRNAPGRFREVLEGVHSYLDLEVPTALVKIVEIRNSLVHEGRFLPAVEMPILEQYELLCHHTDRLVLALVGYREP